MIYGLIIAAGKQSRFELQTPKALMSYNGSPLLDVNIENMSHVCDEVYVVTSYENKQWFAKYNQLIINSGYGCGDAVMRALALLDLTDEDTVFIQWGDSLHTPSIYRDLTHLYKYAQMCLVPCVKEESPYVQIVPIDDCHLRVRFSKYKEFITAGYHDLSLFYGNAQEILIHLKEFASQIKSFGDTLYRHRHGDEMQFLDVFNETSLRGRVVEYDHYDSFAFNTVEEFNNLCS